MTEVIANPRELTMLAIILRMLVAIILGGCIGFEREIKSRPAGLRTYMLVSLGACIVMMTNQYVYQVYHSGDIVRMGAQVISGIGFLGAGTIIVTAHSHIKGLTTAAGLWAAACAGLAIGIGLYEVAILGEVMVFLILNVLHRLDFWMRKSARVVEAYVELNKQTPLGDFIRHVRRNGIEPRDIQIENENVMTNNTLAFIVTLRSKDKRKRNEILKLIQEIEGVSFVEGL